ncbi:unnamed protein product, partial [Prorocentrum cordatum]
ARRDGCRPPAAPPGVMCNRQARDCYYSAQVAVGDLRLLSKADRSLDRVLRYRAALMAIRQRVSAGCDTAPGGFEDTGHGEGPRSAERSSDAPRLEGRGRKDHPPALGGCATAGAVSLAAVLVLLGACWYEVGEAAVVASDAVSQGPRPSRAAVPAAVPAAGPVPGAAVFHADAARRWAAVAESAPDGAHRVRTSTTRRGLGWRGGSPMRRWSAFGRMTRLSRASTCSCSKVAARQLLLGVPLHERGAAGRGPALRARLCNPYGFAPADPGDFSEHLSRCSAGTGAVAFQNLGGDASLVAPCAAGPSPGAYGHLAAFSRRVPEEQQRLFWAAVGRTLEGVVASRGAGPRTWLSTEGSGVPWLHVRLDSAPKYYHHREYRGEA